MRIPEALARSPLIDAIFEIRFRPRLASTGDILPGMFYGRLPFPLTVSRLTAAAMPSELRDNEPSLQYTALHRLQGERIALQVGDRVLTVSPTMPYPGWQAFRQGVLSVLEVAKELEAVRDVERMSFRFINLIPDVPERQLEALTLNLNGPWGPLGEDGLQLRFEHDYMGHRVIAQVAPNAVAQGKGLGERVGLAVDVDVLKLVGLADFWSKYEDYIEQCHFALKSVFFSLLRPETLERLGPSYGVGSDGD